MKQYTYYIEYKNGACATESHLFGKLYDAYRYGKIIKTKPSVAYVAMQVECDAKK